MVTTEVLHVQATTSAIEVSVPRIWHAKCMRFATAANLRAQFDETVMATRSGYGYRGRLASRDPLLREIESFVFVPQLAQCVVVTIGSVRLDMSSGRTFWWEEKVTHCS
jgi:hypothetical protein